MNLPAISEGTSRKSFWEKPEGITGMIFMGIMAIGGFFLLETLLPRIIKLLDLGITAVGQGITLTILGAVLLGLWMILTNKRVHTLVKYMFKSAMRAITQMFVEIDPIGIMRGYIDTLKKRKAEFDEHKRDMSGVLRTIKESIATNTKNIENSVAKARVAKEQNHPEQVTLQMRNISRLEDVNARHKATVEKMSALYAMLEKYGSAADWMIEDLTSAVKTSEEDRKMMKAAHGAMSSAWGILKDNSEDRELYEMALESTVQDYGRKLGEIEDFMSSSRDIIANIDLQNGVWETKALEKLQVIESQTESLVLGGEKRLLLEKSSNMQIPATASESAQPVAEYSKYFNK